MLAWLLFVGGLLLLGVVDHALRMRDGDVRGGGIGALQQPLVAVLAVAALALAWHGAARLPRGWRGVALLVEGALGFTLYAFAAIAYVCGTGIDCF